MGKVPYTDPLMQVSFRLAGYMLKLSGIVSDAESAVPMLEKAIESGEGLARLRAMLEEMGGDVRFVDDPNLLVRVSRIVPVYPEKAGYIGAIDAKSIGTAALMIGAGRAKVTDRIDPAVGILMKKRYGDRVTENEPYAYIYVNDETHLAEAEKYLASAVTFTDEAPEELPLIYDVVE